MKPITPILSPEQKRAKNQYQMAIVPIGLSTFLGFISIEVIVLLVLNRLNITIGSSGSLIFLPFMFGSFFLAHILAVRKLRRAGFSLAHEEIEILTRVASNQSEAIKEWRYPKTLGSLILNASIPLLISLAGWFLWHWPYSATSWLEKCLGILGFGLFGWWGIVGLIFIRSPHVRIDKEGITAFPSPFWRRRVHWADITQCEIRWVYDYLGNGPSRFFYFKSDKGKIRLRLIPGSLSGLSRDEQAEIEREIKRRLGGEIQSE